MKRLLTLLLLAGLLLPAPALAGPAQDKVKAKVDQVMAILRDPTYKNPTAKAMQRSALRGVADTFFDWVALAQRAAGLSWKSMSPAERKEFTDLFAKILEKTYMDRVQAYTNEEVRFDRETALDKDKADVDTTVLAPSQDIPISYRLYDAGGGDWKVYDVFVEGVSLVKNYRTQFKDILDKNTVSELLSQMRKKAAE